MCRYGTVTISMKVAGGLEPIYGRDLSRERGNEILGTGYNLLRHTIKSLKESYSAISVPSCGNEPTTLFNILIVWDRISDV